MVDPQLYEAVQKLVGEGKDLSALYGLLVPKGFTQDKIAEAYKLASTKTSQTSSADNLAKPIAVDTTYQKELLPVSKLENRTNTVIITTNDIPLLKIIILIVVLSLAFIFVLVAGLAILKNQTFDLQSVFNDLSGRSVSQKMVDDLSQRDIYKQNTLVPSPLIVLWESIVFFMQNLLVK